MLKKELKLLKSKVVPPRVKKMFVRRNMRRVIMWMCFNAMCPIIFVCSLLWARILPFHPFPKFIYDVSLDSLTVAIRDAVNVLLVSLLYFTMGIGPIFYPNNFKLYRLYRKRPYYGCARVADHKYHIAISMNFLDCNYKIGKNLRFKKVKLECMYYWGGNAMLNVLFLHYIKKYLSCAKRMIIVTLPIVLLLICIGVDVNQCCIAFVATVLVLFLCICAFMFLEMIAWILTTIKWAIITIRLNL